MTREQAIEHGNSQLEVFGGEHREFIKLAIKALEQEPRKDEVILTKEEYGKLVSSEFDNGYVQGYREALEQEPKTGHWVKIKPYPLQMHDYECSECGHETDDNTENYCSECGVKMIKSQESEE